MKTNVVTISFDDMSPIFDGIMVGIDEQGRLDSKVKVDHGVVTHAMEHFAIDYVLGKINQHLGQLEVGIPLKGGMFTFGGFSFSLLSRPLLTSESTLDLKITKFDINTVGLLGKKPIDLMVRINKNAFGKFKKAIFLEKEGKWQCIEVIFTVDEKLFKHKYFAPQTYKQRKKTNSELKHFFEVVCGKDYESIEYQNTFEEFAREYCQLINECSGKEFYMKVIPGKNFNYRSLGFEIPFISLRPDLDWGELEELRIEAYEEMIDERKSKNENSETEWTSRNSTTSPAQENGGSRVTRSSDNPF